MRLEKLVFRLRVITHAHFRSAVQLYSVARTKYVICCKFYCISVNIDRFSPNFQYIVAEDVLFIGVAFMFHFIKGIMLWNWDFWGYVIFLILRVFPIRDDFFFKPGFYIAVFREQSLRYFYSIFPRLLIRYTLENSL